MSTFVESLRRLRLKGSAAASDAHLHDLLNRGKITQKEYDYIVSK